MISVVIPNDSNEGPMVVVRDRVNVNAAKKEDILRRCLDNGVIAESAATDEAADPVADAATEGETAATEGETAAIEGETVVIAETVAIAETAVVVICLLSFQAAADASVTEMIVHRPRHPVRVETDVITKY